MAQALALIRLVVAAQRLGFDTSKNWRPAFHRFVKRHRLPIVKLSARRFRMQPEVLETFIARRTVGSLPKPLPYERPIAQSFSGEAA